MWKYNEKEVASIKDLPENSFGFVYVITYTDGTYYYGKKNLYKKQTLPALKSGEVREGAKRVGKNKGGKRVYFDVVTKESNWFKYKGSCERTEDLEIESKTILEVAYSKRELTYLEAKCLFWESAIEDESCHNNNILNLFFRDNLK